MSLNKFNLVEKLQQTGNEAYYFRDTARNLYLKKNYSGKYDYITTSANIATIKELCKELNISCKTHLKINRIILELLVDKKIIIAPFIKTTIKNSYATRKYSNKIEDMMESQDFTINSFAYDPIKKIMKFFKEADTDVEQLLIKTVGDPYNKITENRLYMLEAGKLLADLGDGWQIEFNTFETIKNRSLEIAIASPQAVGEVFENIMQYSETPSLAFRFYKNSGLLRETVPQLLYGVGLPQSNKSNNLDLFDHIMYALDSVNKTKENYEALRWACIFHDIAKPYTKSYDSRGNIHFYGHDKIGAIFANRWLDFYKFDKNLIHKVSIICKNHLFDASLKLDDSAILRLIKRVGEDNIFDLLEMRIADRYGTGRKDISMKKILILKNKIKKILNNS